MKIVPLKGAGIGERRQFRRLRVNLAGRYMLADGCEYACRIRDVSAGGLALIAPAPGSLGERVIAYINDIGRLEGVVVRTFSTGFAMIFAATEHRRHRIAARLIRLAHQQVLPDILN